MLSDTGLHPSKRFGYAQGMTTSPPNRRRWYQFRLRTLLVFMLLVCVGLSWFSVKMDQARKQREAVEAIRKAGGFALRTYPRTCERPEHVLNSVGQDFSLTRRVVT